VTGEPRTNTYAPRASAGSLEAAALETEGGVGPADIGAVAGAEGVGEDCGSLESSGRGGDGNRQPFVSGAALLPKQVRKPWQPITKMGGNQLGLGGQFTCRRRSP
jgi:hypothetical protein